MIARIWKGAVRRADGDAYAEYMQATGIAGYAATPGNRGAWMLRRDVEGRAEFLMVTLWDSLAAVKAFAGDDPEQAVFYPEDERYLVERDLTATHYEVAGTAPVAAALPARLDGESVSLRPLRIEDAEGLAEIQAEDAVSRWWGPPNLDHLRDKAAGREGVRAFAVEVDGELAGLIEFHEEDVPEFRHASIDLYLSERHHGRGLGVDALRTLVRYLVGERGHHRITIDPAADNAAAIRAFEKAGFRRIGVLRRYWRDPNGTWRDGLLLDLLADEFLDVGMSS